MTSLTLITLAVVAYGVVLRGRYPRALALAGATPAGAALVVGGTAVPTFYAVALGAAAALALEVLARGAGRREERVRFPPGALVLVAFLVWSAAVTALAPVLFDGQRTVTPGNAALVAGVLTSSNVAQVGYLFLGVCVMVLVARAPVAGPGLVGLAAGLCTLLSLWRYLGDAVGLPFPEGVFDASPSFVYIETAPGGVERFRGVLSEPAALAGTSLVTIAYMLPRSLQLQGLRRLGALSVAGAAVFLGLVSTSATFVVAGLAAAAILAATVLLGFVSQRVVLGRVLALTGVLVIVTVVVVLPSITAFVDTTINDKLASSSYSDRTSANTDSIAVFLDTFGIGVGLGSARASSFVPTLLSATGLVGTLLFVAALVALVSRGASDPVYRPVVWALVTLMVVKVAAGPDLSDSSGILWLSLGLLARATPVRARGSVPGRSAGPGPDREPDGEPAREPDGEPDRLGQLGVPTGGGRGAGGGR